MKREWLSESSIRARIRRAKHYWYVRRQNRRRAWRQYAVEPVGHPHDHHRTA